MKNKRLTVFLTTTLLLVGCSSSNSGDSSSEDLTPFTSKEVGIYRNPDVVDKNITLRFYEEMPNVPYISVSKYFKEFFNTEMQVKKDGHTYKYSKQYLGGYVLGFDTKQDLFFSNNLAAFNSHPDFKQVTGKSFLNVDKVEVTPAFNRVVDLKSYSIPVHEDAGEAYLPLTFISQFTGGFSLYNVAYNGKDVYVIDYSGELFDSERTPSTYSSTYYEKLSNMSEARPLDLAKYTYNELCFVFDNLRGYTSQLVFGDNNLLSLGLNGLIEKYYPKLKELLISTNKSDYYKGFDVLFNGLYDGGHTTELVDFSEFDAAIAGEIDQTLQPLKDEYSKRVSKKSKVMSSVAIARVMANQPSGPYTLPGYTGKQAYCYVDEYKTAYIGFNSFDVDSEGWDNYYHGKGEVPVSTDTYAFVRSKFYQAKEDGAENVVLDIAPNGGGNSSALSGLIGLVNGAKSFFSINDTFNRFRSTDYYTVDINLDGKGDEADVQEASQFNFNIGVLTSGYSFSCGNLFPSMMKELGYKIIGEKSGGGSCAINITTSADGLLYVHSSWYCLSDGLGNNIDSGVPVDYAIEISDHAVMPNLYDYSKFYDPAVTGTYLSTAYLPNE